MSDAPVRRDAATTRPRITVCALLTCFNRRDKTLACLRSLAASTGLEHVTLSAVLVDDGSDDDTAQAVRAELPWVEVLTGDGSLFWSRGMHRAFEKALRAGFDHFLWLNDDTLLRADALAGLLACEATLRQRSDRPLIVVGTTADPATGAHTYGGERRRSRLARLRFEPVLPGSVARPCDTMNGNIVLVPARAARRVGNLDRRYEHAMGDTDYALRARRLGVDLWVAPDVQGTCASNPSANTFADRSLGLPVRWKLMLSRKGLPWRSWLVFTRAHAGAVWPLYFAWPYLKLLFTDRWLPSTRRSARSRPDMPGLPR